MGAKSLICACNPKEELEIGIPLLEASFPKQTTKEDATTSSLKPVKLNPLRELLYRNKGRTMS